MTNTSDAEATLTQALITYRKSYEDSIRRLPSSEVEQAKNLVVKVKKLVQESGLSRSLLSLLAEVRHWPAWSNNTNFKDYFNFEAKEVIATEKNGDKGQKEVCVSFAYKYQWYELVFYKAGWNSNLGKVEFISDGKLVFGLEISEDLEHDISTWTDYGLYTFHSGDWMKSLLEIAVDIEDRQRQRRQDQQNVDLLRKAANISLPPKR